MPGLRRQLSLYLPEPERSVVDAVRSRVDPEQFRLIPAHVTLCRDDELGDWLAIRARLDALGPLLVELELGAPLRLPDGCVLLPVTGSTETFDALRARLLAGSPRALRPHVTLLHPRHAQGKEERLDTTRDWDLPARVLLREVSWIEQVDGGPWRVLDTYGSVGGKGLRAT